MSYKPIFLFLSIAFLWASSTAQAQISPAMATLGPSQQQQFSVQQSLGGTPTWMVMPSQYGTITSAGLFTAAATISTHTTVYVYAQSGTLLYQAQVQLSPTPVGSTGTIPDPPPPPPVPVTISVSPSFAYLYGGQSQQFIASVGGSANQQVTWSVTQGVGTISTNGVFSAPGSVGVDTLVTISATSLADPVKAASATILIGPPTPTPPPSSTATSVSPTTASVAPSGTQQFSVLNLPFSTSVTWSLSPPVGSITQSGVYMAPGSVAAQTTITVTAANSSTNSILGTASLTLQASPAPSVSPATATVAPSGTQQFSILNLPSGATVTWSVGPLNGSIAPSGLYTAPGSVAAQTTITVTATNSSTNSVLGTASLTLRASPPPSSVSPATATIAPAATQQFSVLNLPSGVTATWSVSPLNGSINSAGLYTAPGNVAAQTTITVTATNSSTLAVLGTASLTLQASPTPSVSPATATVAPAGIQQFSVQNLPSGASVTWSVTPPTGSISSSGLYTAPSNVAAQTTITVTATNSSTNATLGTASLTLQASPTPSVSPTTATVAPSGTQQFSVQNPPSGDTIAWSISPVTGSIDKKDGLYKAPGSVAAQTTVTVTATDSSTKSVLGTASLTLQASPTPSVSPTTATVAPSGTQQFSVLNLPSGATITWSISPVKGSIAPSGLYTAPGSVADQTTITVKATNSSTNSDLGTASFTLQASPTPSVSPTTATVAPSGTQQFSVLNLPSGATIAWSISPATGSIAETGLYTAPSNVAAQTTISVKATNSSTNSDLGTASFTLQASPKPSVSPTTAIVAPSGTQQFSVLNLPSGDTITWSISPADGSIAAGGLYTAPSTVATQTTITVKATNSSTSSVLGTASFTLQASPAPSVSPTTATVAPSATQQFSVLNLPSGVTVTWSVSPLNGSINSAGLYTAPGTVATQTAITVTATNSSTNSVLGTASFTLQASPAPTSAIVLPVEVMGANPTTVPVSFTIPSGSNLSGKLQLWLQIHGLEYQTQASVQVNGGAWIPINDSTATYLGHSGTFGGIGGGFATLQLTINLPAGSIQTGQNTLTFSFNGTNGISSGFRVLNLNVLTANGSQLIPQSTFTQDDPTTWTPPLNDSADIQAGQSLWQTANLTTPGTGAIHAKCANCHAQDGRDLTYFNYSNFAIEARSMFHGLTAQQGAQIASYIRTLNAPASSYARPWNPPYQPGPGTDSRAVSDWSAGAGLSAVLDLDAESLPYILPGGSTANLAQSGYLNQREIPIELQLRDWNHWLPTIHPMDAFGSQFTSSPLFTGYALIRSELVPNDPTTYLEYYTDISLQWLTNQNSFYAAVRQPETSSAWNNPVYDRQIYSVAQWMMVKSWEINQEYGLEGMSQVVFGPQAADRAWFSNQAFFTSPQMLKIPNPSPGIGNGTALAHDYDAFIWYHTQLILNDGNGQAQGTWPIDHGYVLDYLYNNLTWNSAAMQPRVGTAGLFMEWLAKTLQANDANASNPYFIAAFPGEVSTWSELPSTQKVQLMNDWVNAWWSYVQGLTRTQIFTAASGVTPMASKTFSLSQPGSFTGDLAFALPQLRFDDVNTSVLDQIVQWASGYWPSFNWSDDLAKPCHVGNLSEVNCP